MRCNKIGVCAFALAASAAAQVNYTITTFAGTDFAGDGGPALAAQLGQPQGLAVDPAGNLYVADASDNRVRKITPAGVISTVAGTGRAGFRGDGGPADAALLDQPYGLALDRAGNLYIADFGNKRVRKVTADGIIYTVAGGGSTLAASEGGDATQAELKSARNVALDPEGGLYVSDFSDHCVYKVTPGGIISRLAGTGVAGPAGDSGPATAAQLKGPAGLVVDRSGALLIADSGNYRIRRVSGGVISTVANAAGLPFMPLGLTLDAAGQLHIAGTGPGFAYLLKLTVSGIRPFAGAYDGRVAALNSARDIAFAPSGSLYVSEDRRVRTVNPAGAIGTVAGDGTFRPPWDGGKPTSAHVVTPSALALDREGNLYVADPGNARVRRISPDGTITTVAGDGTLDTTASVPAPSALATDLWGNLWIADGKRIRKLNAAGVMKTVVDGTQPDQTGDGSLPLSNPGGLAVDSTGNLYFSDRDNHVIRKLSPGGEISVVAGKGVRGRGGDGGSPLGAQFNAPNGLCFDAAGSLYIADTGNGVIRKISTGPDRSPVITTVAGGGPAGDGGPATAAFLSAPSRIAFDGAGNLYIADTWSHQVRKVTTDGVIATIAGAGVPGFEGDGGPAALAQLRSPADVVVDPTGNVYIADSGNDRIRKLTPGTAVQPPPEATLDPLRVVNAASLLSGPVAPGEIVTLFGTGLGPDVGRSSELKTPGLLDTTLADTQVLFDGQPAPLLYVQAGQVNVLVPYGIKAQSATEIEVRSGGAVKGRQVVPTAEAVPALFTVSGGTGQAAATNEDGSPNSAFNPAERGRVVTFYATGEGQTEPAGTDGKLAEEPFPRPFLPVTLRIGGYRAELVSLASAPGLAGVLRIDARIPGDVPSGSLLVALTVGIATSQPGVAVAVR